EVFTVGDEFQSIYGFRHADVEVFRERRAQATNLLTLRSNYRSRAQVLAAVNHLFAGEFGDEFQPLTASAEFADPVFGHPVDLLAYLRLLHNRYDDVALASVLASPFVGASNDALVLLRRGAPRRPLYTALEHALPESLGADDQRLLRAFRQRYERLVRAATRIP